MQAWPAGSVRATGLLVLTIAILSFLKERSKALCTGFHYYSSITAEAGLKIKRS